jgi:hypothetical protein
MRCANTHPSQFIASGMDDFHLSRKPTENIAGGNPVAIATSLP